MNNCNFFERLNLWAQIFSSVKKSFRGLIRLSSEQFTLLASSQKLWAHRCTRRVSFPALDYKKGQCNRNKLEAIPKHQITQMITLEMMGRLIRKFSSFNQSRKDTKADELLPSEMEVESTGPHVPGGDANGRNYVVTLLDQADNSILVQFVKAMRGVDAANYALSFDEAEKAREEGYQVISVFSSVDLDKLKHDLDEFGGKTIDYMDADEDTAILPGAFISD